ncbi:MAG: hypothetical protein HOV94_12560 [Saccharothrix sp.]|nr:hypothetical protein [Saccharothrix sp.]
MSDSDGMAEDPPMTPDAVALVIEEDDSFSSDEIAFWLAEQLAGQLDAERALAGVVGELLDNARLHAAPPYVLRLGPHETRDAVVVAVRDRPVTRSGGWRCGAGLLLVDALSARWGVPAGPGSTVAWAELVFE